MTKENKKKMEKLEIVLGDDKSYKASVAFKYFAEEVGRIKYIQNQNQIYDKINQTKEEEERFNSY